MDLDLKRHRWAARLVAAGVFMLISWPALAVDQVHDEIQVYKGDMAEVGQWSYEQHLNFAAIGQTQPEFPGGESASVDAVERSVPAESVVTEATEVREPSATPQHPEDNSQPPEPEMGDLQGEETC
jgi:hypothetical protein